MRVFLYVINKQMVYNTIIYRKKMDLDVKKESVLPSLVNGKCESCVILVNSPEGVHARNEVWDYCDRRA